MAQNNVGIKQKMGRGEAGYVWRTLCFCLHRLSDMAFMPGPLLGGVHTSCAQL